MKRQANLREGSCILEPNTVLLLYIRLQTILLANAVNFTCSFACRTSRDLNVVYLRIAWGLPEVQVILLESIFFLTVTGKADKPRSFSYFPEKYVFPVFQNLRLDGDQETEFCWKSRCSLQLGLLGRKRSKNDRPKRTEDETLMENCNNLTTKE